MPRFPKHLVLWWTALWPQCGRRAKLLRTMWKSLMRNDVGLDDEFDEGWWQGWGYGSRQVVVTLCFLCIPAICCMPQLWTQPAGFLLMPLNVAVSRRGCSAPFPDRWVTFKSEPRTCHWLCCWSHQQTKQLLWLNSGNRWMLMTSLGTRYQYLSIPWQSRQSVGHQQEALGGYRWIQEQKWGIFCSVEEILAMQLCNGHAGWNHVNFSVWRTVTRSWQGLAIESQTGQKCHCLSSQAPNSSAQIWLFDQLWLQSSMRVLWAQIILQT